MSKPVGTWTRQEAFELINAERKKNGVPLLQNVHAIDHYYSNDYKAANGWGLAVKRFGRSVFISKASLTSHMDKLANPQQGRPKKKGSKD